MDKYFIQEMLVKGLWGYKDLDLKFYRDVNIIIGPNASGKTTILNILRYIFTVDILNLGNIDFDEVEIKLKSFTDSSLRTIKVVRNDGFFSFFVSKQKFDIKIEHLQDLLDVRERRFRERRLRQQKQYQNLVETVKELINAVWLPVSRRLPIQSDEESEIAYKSEIAYIRRPALMELESVDVRLRELVIEMVTYRLKLEAKIAEMYKEFEKSVLQMILYSKELDRLGSLQLDLPSQEDKNQLIRAFDVAGLLDKQMETRIDEHFSIAQGALEQLRRSASKESQELDVNTILIIPLIGRTKAIIGYARKLDEERNKLFDPLRKFELIVNSFLNDKTVSIDDNGNLTINSIPAENEIRLEHLSSGEKQLLILLIQALLWEDLPVVYVADEPELSLHVSWQEKLLNSLLELARNIQIIVATHSPDIVGPYVEKIIDLGENS